MTTLFLVSGSVAFFVAVIEQIVSLRTFKALLSLLLAAGACGIVGGLTIREFVIYTIAGGFFGPMLALGADKLSTFAPALVRSRE